MTDQTAPETPRTEIVALIEPRPDFLTSDAGPAGIDVETLTAALVDAEDDDQMGPEYRPERLAEYLHDWLDRLSRESDR
jgi:hypothetical protein